MVGVKKQGFTEASGPVVRIIIEIIRGNTGLFSVRNWPDTLWFRSSDFGTTRGLLYFGTAGGNQENNVRLKF